MGYFLSSRLGGVANTCQEKQLSKGEGIVVRSDVVVSKLPCPVLLMFVNEVCVVKPWIITVVLVDSP